MRHALAIATALASTLGSLPSYAEKPSALASEIHTTFQPLLWNGRRNKVQVTPEGKISITEGPNNAMPVLGKAALEALEAAALRLHQRYGGRRAFTVETFGDLLNVRIGPSVRSRRRADHFISVEGTGGYLRHLTHGLRSREGLERMRSTNAFTGGQERRVRASDGRLWIKLLGKDGSFGIDITHRGSKQGPRIHVPAPGSTKPATRELPTGEKIVLPTQRVRRAYRWIGPRAARGSH